VGSGSVSLTLGDSSYAPGTEVSLLAVADPGWEFVDWTGDLTSTANPETIIMDRFRCLWTLSLMIVLAVKI